MKKWIAFVWAFIFVMACTSNETKVNQINGTIDILYKVSEERNAKQLAIFNRDPGAAKGLIMVNGIYAFSDEYLMSLAKIDSNIYKTGIDVNVLQKEVGFLKDAILKDINDTKPEDQAALMHRLDSVLSIVNVSGNK